MPQYIEYGSTIIEVPKKTKKENIEGGYKKGYEYPDNLHWTSKFKNMINSMGFKIVKKPEEDDEITWDDALKYWNAQTTKIIRTRKRNPLTGIKEKYKVPYPKNLNEKIIYLLEKKTNNPAVESYRKTMLESMRVFLGEDFIEKDGKPTKV